MGSSKAIKGSGSSSQVSRRAAPILRVDRARGEFSMEGHALSA